MNPFDERINRYDTHSVKWDHTDTIFEKENLLPMWVADMDFKAPQAVIDELTKRIEHGIFGYSMPTEQTKKTIQSWLDRRHQWTIQQDWIVFTPGVVPALSAAVNTYTKKGEKVVIQSPVYYPFRDMVEKSDRHVVDNPLKLEEDKYVMDYEDLELKLKDPEVTMLILCNPHNPVGRVWTKEELLKLAELCLTYDVLIVSDDIHFDLILKENKHTLISTLSDKIAANTITCVAPSKTFNLAGMQISTIIIPDEEKREQFSTYMGKLGLFAPSPFGITAIEAAYTHGEVWLEELIEYLEGNLDYLKSFIAERIPEIDVIEPEGTYLVWLDFRKLSMPHEKLERFIQEDAKLALDEGYIFGEGGKGFERMNIACPRSILKEGLERLEEAMLNQK
ncbi:MalY/PatB family protein [Pseudalkalibacillus hwajinpoensis]|uniref:cysteine-S-conjugate beta-lyase n=1 Tax=Guptibacillus hwajinpoensis TaxID=208199 RepID=A0A4U1MLB3_9BACL|nr:MalY/PatB family protein [Pseudalkalibacillus hwajinpoensis]TKD71322.1 pyridoxal phosphate-dependent aminotransferase [Pseudalkalibacillus hwajinpoensis]